MGKTLHNPTPYTGQKAPQWRLQNAMIHSINALIARNGNVVRSGIARPETVARCLVAVEHLADYQVIYWLHSRPHRVPGEGFLALYEAGYIARGERKG